MLQIPKCSNTSAEGTLVYSCLCIPLSLLPCIMQLQDAKSTEELETVLNSDEYDFRYGLGVAEQTQSVHLVDKNLIVTHMANHFATFHVKAELDQMLCGLSETLDSLQLIWSDPTVMHPLFVPSDNPPQSTDDVYDLLTMTYSPECCILESRRKLLDYTGTTSWSMLKVSWLYVIWGNWLSQVFSPICYRSSGYCSDQPINISSEPGRYWQQVYQLRCPWALIQDWVFVLEIVYFPMKTLVSIHCICPWQGLCLKSSHTICALEFWILLALIMCIQSTHHVIDFSPYSNFSRALCTLYWYCVLLIKWWIW